MKKTLTITILAFLLCTSLLAQETLIENHQKMVQEIQGEYREFLTEIKARTTGVGSAEAVRASNEIAKENSVAVKDTSMPDTYPVEGIPRITSGYGHRDNPFSQRKEFHRGIDIGVACDTDVRSTADGMVTEVAYDRLGGRYLVLDHGNGYRTYYGHLSSYQVKLGDSVQKGQVIAKSGESGKVTGPHIHYSVYSEEQSTNPLSIIQ